ncbi:MAG: gfo/Idh/MocA family oxidoreductase [Desulfobacteraceae bacterium]|nr:MAG: gfo/Idh/MocA family oxidoreductase [Desulfobacteraceae bacterium]
MREPSSSKPRLGFLGVGWIGGHRLKSLVQSETAEVAAICDPSNDNCKEVLGICPQAQRVADLKGLLGLHPDGIVIATPSAQHAEQARSALEAGVPVFCQKPLALSAAETRQVIAAAREAGCLLGIDLSYRHLRGLDRMRRMLSEGTIGKVFAVDLLFHNAYGPDKAWYYQKHNAGGGCVIDLGTHLVDLMLWVLGYPRVLNVASQLYAGGVPLDGRPLVEDYAAVQIALHGDISARLACSWHLQAGREAVIQAVFYGTRGGLCVRNVKGSFFMFQAEHFKGTHCDILEPPSDDWWGAAAVQWARRLKENPNYDAEVEGLIAVAEVLDAIYGVD